MTDLEGPSPEDFIDIDRAGTLWEGLTELEPGPAVPPFEPPLLAGWVRPAELLKLVNRMRVAQGLVAVPRLTTRHAVPGVYDSCLFALALRAWASMDSLIFRSQRHAELVAAELGVPLSGYCSIATPPAIADVMELFDCDQLCDFELAVPDHPQLSLDASPVDQAQDILRASRTAVC